MKSLFKGKKAFATIPLAIAIVLAFMPFAIGGILGYLAYKKIPNSKMRIVTVGVIVILTLFFGSAWIAAISSPSKPQVEQTKKQEGVKTEEGTSSSVLSESTTVAQSSPKGKEAQVVKVIDGDTIAVAIDGKNTTVRIIGIDTPETVDSRKSVECFGQKASEKAKEQLSGKTIQLEQDSSQGELDKYNRLLRYVWLDNGTVDYGATMIQDGYAFEYTYETPYVYQVRYKELQKEAEQNKRGLWSNNACPSQEGISTETNSQQSTPIYSNLGDKDCSDFSTHAEAQSYFNSKGGSSSINVDRLDNDHDGVACESLP